MSSSPKVCPFCQQQMEYRKGKHQVDEEECKNEACHFHKIPRYSCTYCYGVLSAERIVLTDTLYVSINHLHNETTISKLDVIVVSDHVILPRALKLDLKNHQQAIDKIQTLLLFS